VARARRIEPSAQRFDAQHRDVGIRIRSDDLGIELASVPERDLDCN
jgi:hypothetical protein